jgi:hypothetical protein
MIARTPSLPPERWRSGAREAVRAPFALPADAPGLAQFRPEVDQRTRVLQPRRRAGKDLDGLPC